MCVFETAAFEVVAFLKWMPWKSKLKSGTCITIKKISVRTYTIIYPVILKTSKSMVEIYTAWVADVLKVRGRAFCNLEIAHLNRVIVANPIIIIQAIV